MSHGGHGHHTASPISPEDSLARLLPSVATSLGVAGLARPGDRLLEPAQGAVVVLIDGLGARLLARRGGHAPFLRSLLNSSSRDAARVIGCGFPSTTATSMGTFGTGQLSGEHGLVGYEVLDPALDTVFNELSWEGGPNPRGWQPHPTVFEASSAAGVEVVRVGPAFFDGSGLTEAALRGGRFVAASSLPGRVDATLAALRRQPKSLVYLYWGDLDKVGHVHGCESWQWGDELESIDAELARLARSLPAGVALHITADHGMVDVPPEGRIELSDEPDLDRHVRHVAGEPRCLQLHVTPGATADVLDAWRSRVGGVAEVVERDEAIALGWFGPTTDRVRPRIGEVIVAMTGAASVVDSRRHRPELRALIGVHGSITADEVDIPWLMVPA